MKTLLTLIANALRRFFAALRPASAATLAQAVADVKSLDRDSIALETVVKDLDRDLDKLAQQLDRIDTDGIDLDDIAQLVATGHADDIADRIDLDDIAQRIDLDDIAQRVATDHCDDILNSLDFEDHVTQAAETAVAEAFAEQREAVSSETKPPSDENLSDLAEIVNAQGAEIAKLKALIDAQAHDLKLVTQAAEAFASALRPGEAAW